MFVSADAHADPQEIGARTMARTTVASLVFSTHLPRAVPREILSPPPARAVTQAASVIQQVSLRGPSQSFFTINEILENGTVWPEGLPRAGLRKIDANTVTLPRERRSTPSPHHNAATPLPRGPAQFFTINEIIGNSNGDTHSIHVSTDNDEPFGMTAFVLPEGVLWTKWREVQADTDQEMPALQKCVADQNQCTAAAALFGAIVFGARQRMGHARLELVHRLVNFAIRYKGDEEQWGVPDLWSAPLSTFGTGFGDCEDYVIAKYVALRESGVLDDDLRMVLGYDKGRRSGHAVLAVRNDGDWLVLDHLAPRPLDATDLSGFVPLFSFNTHGVSLLAMPYTRQPHAQIASTKLKF
jgi:predicted transglutaminase-like cysteine proteinase